mgnify:CR=1 FL=1
MYKQQEVPYYGGLSLTTGCAVCVIGSLHVSNVVQQNTKSYSISYASRWPMLNIILKVW